MAKQESGSTTTEAPAVRAEREPTFTSRYANNIRYEATVHDLKLIFGQSDLSRGGEVVQQHTAITIPFTLLKATLYFLRLNLAFHELYNGPVSVAPPQIPPPFEPPSEEVMAQDPRAIEAHAIATRLRKELLESLAP